MNKCVFVLQFNWNNRNTEQRNQKACYQGNGAHRHGGSPTRTRSRSEPDLRSFTVWTGPAADHLTRSHFNSIKIFFIKKTKPISKTFRYCFSKTIFMTIIIITIMQKKLTLITVIHPDNVLHFHVIASILNDDLQYILISVTAFLQQLVHLKQYILTQTSFTIFHWSWEFETWWSTFSY